MNFNLESQIQPTSPLTVSGYANPSFYLENNRLYSPQLCSYMSPSPALTRETHARKTETYDVF